MPAFDEESEHEEEDELVAAEGGVLSSFAPLPYRFHAASGGLDADLDGLLEGIALRDAAALENAFYDLKGGCSTERLYAVYFAAVVPTLVLRQVRARSLLFRTARKRRC
jgi:hypothetical protein